MDFLETLIRGLTDPLLGLLCAPFRSGRSGEASKLFSGESQAPVTEEERLRDKLEDRTRCLNRRM